MTKLNDLAKQAREALHRIDREADGIGKVLAPIDFAKPEWLQDLCYKAHTPPGCSAIPPDDWRYEFIGDALNVISEADTDDELELREQFEQWFDGAYVYTHEQTAWLHSRADRSDYCDEACKEFGGEHDTLQRVALGMMVEGLEVFELVLGSLRELQGVPAKAPWTGGTPDDRKFPSSYLDGP